MGARRLGLPEEVGEAPRTTTREPRTMRLTPEARQIIKASAQEIFGPDATVCVFGSRTNDEARGGDIDLLVECTEPVEDRLRKTLALTASLQRRLGDQQIDVIVADPQTKRRPVHEVARRTGVPL